MPEEIAAIAAGIPVIGVLWLWNQHLMSQVRELREQRDRWISEYLNHLRSTYNLAIELELKKRIDEQTEMK